MLLFMHNIMETKYLFIWQIHSHLPVQGSQMMFLSRAQVNYEYQYSSSVHLIIFVHLYR